MTPTEVAESYVYSHVLAAGTIRNITGAALRYEAALRRGADPWDHTSVNRYLTKVGNRNSASYHNSERRYLIMLWRHAADLKIADEPVVRLIRKARVDDRVIRTLSIDDVRALRKAASQMQGAYRMKGGITRAAFWVAFIGVKWDTALRHCDVFAIRHKDVSPTGVVHLVQQKTGKRHVCQLSPQTLADVHATRTIRTRPAHEILPWPYTNKTFVYHARSIFRAAGIDGNMKMLRASAGTAFEEQNPGHGHELLGNTRAQFLRHYRDVTRIERDQPRPPQL